MPLPDLINALITEHGSAGILRERLEQIKEQTIPVLEENRKMKSRVAELEDIVRRLTTELKSKAESDSLPAEAEMILLFFFKRDESFAEEEVIKHFKNHPSVTRHRMDTLREKGLLNYASLDLDDGFETIPLAITADGRKYVVEHGLYIHADEI